MLVALRDVAVRRGERWALRGVTLDVTAGGALALVGPNGSGKTTLLHLLAGLLEASTGFVERRGAARVAYVVQRHEHHRWMPLTVAEVLRMGRYAERGAFGRLTADDRAIVARAAERLDVVDLWRRQFGELSGGQRQRVLVAQALAQRPELLLLDEPVTGLDLPSQERILELVDELTGDGVGVVLSTHHLEEARRCDAVALLAGRLVGVGPPGEVLVPELLSETFVGRVLPPAGDGGGPPTVLDDHGHGCEEADPTC